MSESAHDRLAQLEQLREELILGGRNSELEALDQVISQARATAAGESSGGQSPSGSATGGAREGKRGRKGSGKTYLKLKKKFYTPAEVARKVGVSRQTVVKWIERGELDAELTPGGHHRIPASVFHREGRGEPVQMIPVEEE